MLLLLHDGFLSTGLALLLHLLLELLV